MSNKKTFSAAALVLASACLLPLFAQTKPEAEPKGETPVAKKSGVVLVSISGEVSEKDPKKRELTIRQFGSGVTLKIDRELKTFDKVKVGDTIRAEYYLVGGGEIRPPTEAEKALPLTLLEDGKSSEQIAGKDVKVYKMVATVEGLDRSNSTITVKGPLGRYVTVPVKDLSIYEKVRIGETIVISAADPLAVSLEILHPQK